MISTFFASGVIVGLTYLLLSDSNANLRAPTEEDLSANKVQLEESSEPNQRPQNDASEFVHQSQKPQPSDPLALVADLIVEGDSYLLLENFAAAAKRYTRAQQSTGRMSNDLLLRLAFCAEFSRQYRSATEHYNRVLENRPTTTQRWIALSGIGRSWIERGNRSEALAILCDLFLESFGEESIPTALKAQVHFQLGVALQEVTLQDYHYDLSRPDGVSFHTATPWIEELLLLVDPSNSVDVSRTQAERFQVLKQNLTRPPLFSRTPADEHPQISVVQRPNTALELTTVDIRSPLVSMAELIKQLAAACEVELFVSKEAESLFSARSKAVNTQGVPVSLVLDSVLLPLNILWYQDDKGLHLVSHSESGELAEKYFPAAMERTYRRFVVSFPGDYRVSSALLARANLKLISGDMNQAAVHYQEILQRNPKEELLAKVFFNVGKIEMRLGRNEQALKQFYRAADQTYNRDLQAAAYWLVAQICLEAHRLPESIKTAGRSLALAQVDDQRRLAALTLARAYLISNQPLSANQVLFENRNAFVGTTLESSAAVVGSLARFLGMTDKSSLNSEANRLLSAIAMAPSDQYEHFLDIYISARAWLELGFRDKAIEMLTLAADSTTISAWRRQFLFELGIQLLFSNQPERAIAVFEFLANGEEDVWLEKSLIQLGLLYLKSDRSEDAISIGERLLARQLDENSRQQVLQTMGKAYRELGQHHAAAVCFAGMLPKKEASSWQ